MTALMKFDFNGEGHSFDGHGWFNATEAAKRFDKVVYEWLRLPETERYLAALCKKNESGKSLFVKTRRGGNVSMQGTWLHPKLAVRFAQWLDVDFAVWCDDTIDQIIRTQSAPPAIQNLMQLLLKDSASEWELRFPDDYYRALARITNTTYDGHSGGTPAVFGQITLNWVYGVILPKDVLSELKSRQRNSAKMHQWLTDGGNQVLDKQIAAVTTLAESAVDYQDFLSRCTQTFSHKGQVRLVYPV
ncbi:MAG: P63C domain-containing protein [Moraxellaceae bacterium]